MNINHFGFLPAELINEIVYYLDFDDINKLTNLYTPNINYQSYLYQKCKGYYDVFTLIKKGKNIFDCDTYQDAFDIISNYKRKIDSCILHFTQSKTLDFDYNLRYALKSMYADNSKMFLSHIKITYIDDILYYMITVYKN